MKNPTSGVNEDPVVNMQMLVKGMIETLPATTIDRLASVNIKERRQSVSDIISVVPNTQDRPNVIQIIPLELLANNKIVEAIWYMIEEGRRAKLCFSSEVIRSVFDAAYGMKEQYETISPQSEIQISDMVFLQKTLKQMLLTQLDLSQGNMELFPIVWDYYALFEVMPDIAQSYYYDAMGIGDMTAILRSAQYFMDVGNIKVAFSLLKNGYEQSKSTLFLEKHIELLFLLGDTKGAEEKYALLKKDFPTRPFPILKYKWHIENDNDLREWEIIMDQFYENPLPTRLHMRLAVSAREYLNKGVEETLTGVQDFNNDSTYYDEKIALIFQRISYMEKHIFILLDDMYMETYLAELKSCLLGDIDMQVLLSEYFETHPLPLLANQIRFDDLDEMGKLVNSELTHPKDLEGVVRQRLTYIACRFFEAWKEAMFDSINLLASKYMREYPEMEENSRHLAHFSKKEKNEMSEISEDASGVYFFMISSLDTKYGTHFRRHMQYMARHSYRHWDTKCQEILRSIPQAGAFFLIESMISNSHFSLDMAQCVDDFSLELLPDLELLLFARILLESHFPEVCIALLSKKSWFLSDAESLGLIVEAIGYLDTLNARTAVAGLDVLCQNEYDEKSFFTFVNKAAKNMKLEVEDQNSILLAQWHLHRFHGRSKKALKKFNVAAKNGSREAHFQAALMLEKSMGKKEQALEMYQYLISLDQDIRRTEILQNVIGLCTTLGYYDLRNKYIQIGIHGGNLDASDSFSIDLHSNDDEDKYRALRNVAVASDGMYLSDSEKPIFDRYVDDCITKEELEEALDLKKFVVASYLQGFALWNEDLVEPENLIQHWRNIASVGFDPDEEAVSSICEVYCEFIDVPDSQLYDNSFQELAALMDIHAFDSSVVLSRVIKKDLKEWDKGLFMKHMEDYAYMLGIIIFIFWTIPEAGPYALKWQIELDDVQKWIYMSKNEKPLPFLPGNHTFLQ